MTKKLRELLLLLLWICLGTIFRFLNLDLLPPWTDECATIAFSLGNSFQIVPVNEIISTEVLLAPLTPNYTATVSDVVHHLFTESTHPPVYFILAHWWMKMFSPAAGLDLIWIARSLSAFFGVAAIPAMFIFAKLTVNSTLIAQISAAVMALSPFAIYLAREARHYTLVILLVIASLTCFIKAIQLLDKRATLPFWICLIWISVNCVGIATHFFFSLTLLAELFIFLGQGWSQFHKDKNLLLQSPWRRIYLVAAGTLIGCLVWLPILGSIYQSPLTQWVSDGEPRINWLEPILRMLLWWWSMLILLPTAFNNISLWVVVISGIVTILFLGWALPKLISGLKFFAQDRENRLITQALIGYIGGAIALFFLFTYGLAMDLTLAPRFQFVYFPAVVILLAISLASCWQQLQQKSIIKAIFSFAIISSLTVVNNLGYLQQHRPDLLAPIIQQNSENSVLIATTHKHHGQTGRMMGLAWEFTYEISPKNQSTHLVSPQFFLAHRSPETRSYATSVKILSNQLTEVPFSLDLWLVDFRAEIDLEPRQCTPDSKTHFRTGEYKYKLYHCPSIN
ncbi:MAG: hypothetical protein SAL07_16990 [Oscillatoria sp. PMC 1051.18]|nr:hypothetical protein [Oscillatoria sp. PMC 1050.18]MEC5031597.1 hypothetical protein [Oscillatoria sp. PMC 1051.18]